MAGSLKRSQDTNSVLGPLYTTHTFHKIAEHSAITASTARKSASYFVRVSASVEEGNIDDRIKRHLNNSTSSVSALNTAHHKAESRLEARPVVTSDFVELDFGRAGPERSPFVFVCHHTLQL